MNERSGLTFAQANAEGVSLVATDGQLWHNGTAIESVIKLERKRCADLAARLGAPPNIVEEINGLKGIGADAFNYTQSLKSEITA